MEVVGVNASQLDGSVPNRPSSQMWRWQVLSPDGFFWEYMWGSHRHSWDLRELKTEDALIPQNEDLSFSSLGTSSFHFMVCLQESSDFLAFLSFLSLCLCIHCYTKDCSVKISPWLESKREAFGLEEILRLTLKHPGVSGYLVDHTARCLQVTHLHHCRSFHYPFYVRTVSFPSQNALEQPCLLSDPTMKSALVFL